MAGDKNTGDESPPADGSNRRMDKPEENNDELDKSKEIEDRAASIAREQYSDPKALAGVDNSRNVRARQTVEHELDGANPFRLDGVSEERPANAARTQERPANAAGTQERPANTGGAQERPASAAGPSERPTNAGGAPERPANAAGTSDRPTPAAGAHPEQRVTPVVKPGDGQGAVDYDFLYTAGPKSDAAQAREDLKKQGVDTTNPKTGIDLYEPFYQSAPLHLAKVKETIVSPEYGMSPGANVRGFEPPESSRNLKLSDYSKSPNQLADFAAAHSTQTVRDLSGFIENTYLKDGTQGQSRVLNVSHEHSQLTTAEFAAAQMRKDPEGSRQSIEKVLGKERGNSWIENAKTFNKVTVDPSAREGIVKVVTGDVLEREMREKLIPHVKQAVENSQEFKDAMNKYRDVTRRAADSGVSVVVCAGNDGHRADGSVYNYYAQSDHVIGVAGHDSNKTPTDTSDDQMWDGSSPGNARYQPTVTAESHNVSSEVDQTLQKSGTSFGAPLVSATIANMRDQNPAMTFEQTKAKLQQNARPFPGVSSERQGAGRLDSVKAILSARQEKKDT